jgi:hypothetical protein
MKEKGSFITGEPREPTYIHASTNWGMMRFAYSEDQQYFYDLLCVSGEDLSRYASLFDFRSASVKRREFHCQRARLRSQLVKHYGHICQLRS